MAENGGRTGGPPTGANTQSAAVTVAPAGAPVSTTDAPGSSMNEECSSRTSASGGGTTPGAGASTSTPVACGANPLSVTVTCAPAGTASATAPAAAGTNTQRSASIRGAGPSGFRVTSTARVRWLFSFSSDAVNTQSSRVTRAAPSS